MIPLFKPKIYEESIKNVERILRSSWIGLGPETAAFEEEFATYLKAKYVVALNSGTESLRLAVLSAKSLERPIAISTPNTFVSTNHVLIQNGLKIIFADIDPNTGGMDPNSVERILDTYGKYISLIMLVHYGGMPLDIDKFKELISYYNITLIEDCAHATGAVYKDRLIGAKGTYNCFSFHAVKNLSMGDGGALVTDNARVYNEIKQNRWLGIDKSTIDRISNKRYTWDYDCLTLGYKSHMNDIMAAIGRGQLLHIGEDNAYRARLVDRYCDNLFFMGGVMPLKRRTSAISSNHLFVVKFDNVRLREKVIDKFEEKDIGYGFHYKPNYLYKPYKECFVESTKGMTEFYQTALTLPLHLYLTIDDVDRICEVIKEAM